MTALILIVAPAEYPKFADLVRRWKCDCASPRTAKRAAPCGAALTSGSSVQDLLYRRAMPRPSRPVPRSAMETGSGTASLGMLATRMDGAPLSSV